MTHPYLMPHGFFTVVRDYYTAYREAVLNPALGEPDEARCPGWWAMNLSLEVVDILDTLYMDSLGDVERMMRFVAVRFGEMPAPALLEQQNDPDTLYHRARYGEHYVGIWRWRTDWLDY